ncbi:MAG: ABC transporter ATP-binding protein [Puniceicoccaceae bacterium]
MKGFLPYFRLLRPVRWLFAFAVLCGIINGIASGFGLAFAVDYIFPLIFPDQGSLEGVSLSLSQLLLYALFLPITFAVRGLSGFANIYYMSYCGVLVLEQIRTLVFSHLQFVSLRFYQKNRTGDLISRLIADTQLLQQIITFVANDLIRQPVTLLGALGFLAWKAATADEFGFLLLSLMILPITILPIRAVGKRMLKKAKLMQDQAGDLTGIISENLSAPREIRAFGLEEHQNQRFSSAVRRLFHHQMKVVKYSQVLSPSIEFIASCGIGFAVLYASRSGLTLQEVVPLVFALYMAYEPVKRLGGVHNKIRQGVAALERIDYILHQPVDIQTPTRPLQPPYSRGEVNFEAVDFSYDELPTLKAISTTIQQGEIVALVGPSGSGKSTFVSLILRLFDPASGSILLNGLDLRDWDLAKLRASIAYVAQEPILFNDTVRENIRLGRLGATDEEVEEAATLAFASEFIAELPLGFETVLGERGSRLSGGQRQRISIARAFLRQAPILILDEATSALDAESEDQIQQAISRLVQGKTTLIIAHRFSSIRIANRILLFDHGKIVATGTHESLLSSSDLYRDLYQRQIQA